MPRTALAAAALLAAIAVPASAQNLVTLPPDGDNQRAAVTQYMGLVAATIEYNSPDVHAPDGADRRGKIWGELVPYGMTDLGFNGGKPSPWRAGANENTTFTVSHDVLVEGKPLPAGRYGLHMIPGPEEWTVVFSKNATTWGSYFYDEADDALRVQVKPVKNEYNEWLTYEFDDRKLDSAVAALEWEDLRVPFRIAAPNVKELYFQKIADDLRGSPGFNYQAYETAAQFAAQNDLHLDQALVWAEKASAPPLGRETLSTLATKALVLEKLGRGEEARQAVAKALDLPTVSATEIHMFGRQLQAQGKVQEAVEVFKHNAKRYPGVWPTPVGLARAHSALGEYQTALEHAKTALAQAPDAQNKQSLERAVKLLQEGKDFNN
ncbi:MAG TPA: DUF2911 domain-containing protein [Thermoanaerobaculia bacterium]|nr:DUF2911 domain-containing protein [Thermoanaerobaculia bacterium]